MQSSIQKYNSYRWVATMNQASSLVIDIEPFIGSLQHSYKVHVNNSLCVPIALGRRYVYLSSMWSPL